MVRRIKTFTTSMGTFLGTFLFVVGLTTNGWAQGGVGVGGGVPTLGGSQGLGQLQGPLTLKGKIVCTDCTLAEARKAHPTGSDFYELTSAIPNKGQVVIKVDQVNNKRWWKSLVGLTHRLSVRAEEDVWKGLTDEENLFKNMQVSGVLHPSRTLNINSVKIEGQTLSELNRTRTLKKAVTASLKAQNAATRAETAAMQAETAALRAETVTEQTERAAQRMEKTQTE